MKGGASSFKSDMVSEIRQQVERLKLALEKFSISSYNLNLLLNNQKIKFSRQNLWFGGPKYNFRNPKS